MLALNNVSGPRYFVSSLVDLVMVSIFTGLIVIVAFFLLRALLRNQKVAIASAVVLIAAVTTAFFRVRGFEGIVILLIASAIVLFMLMRFGLVAGTFSYFVGTLLTAYPIDLDTATWYSGYGVAALVLLAGIVLYAFRYSLGGRPLIASSSLDE
jgi:hypothetical protein